MGEREATISCVTMFNKKAKEAHRQKKYSSKERGNSGGWMRV